MTEQHLRNIIRHCRKAPPGKGPFWVDARLYLVRHPTRGLTLHRAEHLPRTMPKRDPLLAVIPTDTCALAYTYLVQALKDNDVTLEH